MSDDAKTPTTPLPTRTRQRSAGFPVLSLLDAAEVLRKAGKLGTTHTLSSLAGLMGHRTTNSGPFKSKLAALRDWGVIDGRGDKFSLTAIGLAIALPTDSENEANGLREAFFHCEIFARTYRAVVKNKDVEITSLANTAVHNYGVASAAKNDYARSLITSAVAAGLAELVGDKAVRFLPEPADGEPVALVSTVPQTGSVPSATVVAGVTTVRSFDGEVMRPVLRQVWPTESGQVVVEIRSARPLRAEEFNQVARVVTEVQALAALMGEAPDAPR